MGDILGLARMVDGIGRGHRTDIYGLHDAAASGQGPGRSDERLATQASRWYDYGYVCNSDPTDETGSSFDIGWARDKEGNKVNLPGIDFVKIQNATLQDLGYGYGPACVLFNCAIDLHLAGKRGSKQLRNNI